MHFSQTCDKLHDNACAKCVRGKHGCARTELQWSRFDLSFSLKGTGNQITEKRDGQSNHGLYSKWAKEQLHENVIARLSLENNCHHHLHLWSFLSVCVKRCRDKCSWYSSTRRNDEGKKFIPSISRWTFEITCDRCNLIGWQKQDYIRIGNSMTCSGIWQ